MENISNQLSYLKGLIDGLNVDPDSDYGRIFEGIVNVLDEINDSVDDIMEYQDELADQVDMIDEDLASVEEELMGDEEFFDTDRPVTCPSCGNEFDIDFDCDGICEDCDKCDE